MKLIDSDGRVLEFPDDSVYPPQNDGTSVVPIRRYTYFVGKRTELPATHTVAPYDKDGAPVIVPIDEELPQMVVNNS